MTLTHLERVYFPQVGIVKAEVLQYYLEVAPYLIPHLRDRPLSLERYPEGVEGPSFYQKDAPTYFPDWLRVASIAAAHRAKTVRHPLVDDSGGLLYLVNLGTLTLHTTLARIDDLDHPDILVLDIDPPAVLSGADAFRRSIEAARLLRDEMRAAGLDPLVKTSGKRGLHLGLPLDRRLTYAQVREVLGEILAAVIARAPDRLTREARKERRGDRVYLDALRMAPGATVVPPYVVRATDNAAVSMPVEWEELDTLEHAGAFTIRDALPRLERTGDLWASLAEAAGSGNRMEGDSQELDSE